LGIQKGRHIEIFNSYELIFNGDTLDVQYFQEKQGQCSKFFNFLKILIVYLWFHIY